MDQKKYSDGAPILKIEELQGLTASALFHAAKCIQTTQETLFKTEEFKQVLVQNPEKWEDYAASINALLKIVALMRGIEQ